VTAAEQNAIEEIGDAQRKRKFWLSFEKQSSFTWKTSRKVVNRSPIHLPRVSWSKSRPHDEGLEGSAEQSLFSSLVASLLSAPSAPAAGAAVSFGGTS
jgi:hypothetical protein